MRVTSNISRAVQCPSRPLQGGRLPDAEADGRIRGQSPSDRLRLSPDGAFGRSGQVHGARKNRTFQAKLLQILSLQSCPVSS